MTLPMLCIDEPYASAIFAGLKQWETRTCPPNGDMRPDGVRGFPGVKVNRGDRIIIASTKRRPRHEQHDADDDVPTWCDLYTFAPFVEWTEHVDDPGTGVHRWSGPVGVILGTVTVTDAVPISHRSSCILGSNAAHICFSPNRIVELCTFPDVADISDQLPWGTWDAGRWAWALADPIPTTEQCPWCMGYGYATVEGIKSPIGGSGRSAYLCPVCEGEGRCDPIPVTGHQGLRVWNGEVRR